VTATRRLEADRTSIRNAGILLGVGFGGFFDGIVLHQILQWHHLLTSTGDHPATTVAGLEDNTLADGFFHLFAKSHQETEGCNDRNPLKGPEQVTDTRPFFLPGQQMPRAVGGMSRTPTCRSHCPTCGAHFSGDESF
jgi:Predicted membrane protein (DUF2243)